MRKLVILTICIETILLILGHVFVPFTGYVFSHNDYYMTFFMLISILSGIAYLIIDLLEKKKK